MRTGRKKMIEGEEIEFGDRGGIHKGEFRTDRRNKGEEKITEKTEREERKVRLKTENWNIDEK